jgi:hypothetical protein
MGLFTTEIIQAILINSWIIHRFNPLIEDRLILKEMLFILLFIDHLQSENDAFKNEIINDFSGSRRVYGRKLCACIY